MKQPMLIKLLLIILVIVLAESSIHHRHMLKQSNLSRTDTLYARCPIKRTPFFNMQYNDSTSAGRLQTAAALKLNGDALIYDLITKNNTGAKQEVNKAMETIIVYVIFMAIGLILMLILAPILICCCVKPDKCPPCLACRAPQSHIYTNCQRRWPSIPIIVLSIVLIGTMIAGYSQTRCATAMLFDDLLNGNFTKDEQQYFIGLKPMGTKLQTVSGSLNNLFDSLSGLSQNGNVLNNFVDRLKNLKHLISDIPNGDGTQSTLHLTYQSPLNSKIGHKTQKIQSTINNVIGNNVSSFTLIGQAHNGLTITEHTLQSISQLTNLASDIVPKLSQTINQGFNTYYSLVGTVQQLDTETDQQLTTVQNSYLTPYNIIIYIIAGLAIVTSIVLIVATAFICFKNNIMCTKVINVACVILSILCILCFVLSIALSAATAGTHFGCHYIQVGIQTKTQFVYRFKPLLKDSEALTQMMAQCACKQGSGVLLEANIVDSFIKNANTGIAHLSSLDTNHLGHVLEQSKKNLHSTLQSYHRAEQLDIDSIPDLQILEKLSDPKQYSCQAPGFYSDSWVPSVNQNAIYVDCKIENGQSVTNKTCKSKEDFQARRKGCTGCIDTFDILGQYKTYDDVLIGLKNRYWAPDCQQFINDLANTWHNFYFQKSQALAPVVLRAYATSQLIDEVTNQMHEKIQPKLKQTLFHFQNSLFGITHEAQPALNHINCKVLGQDLQLITNTFCTQIFNYSFSMRILMMISGFTLLVLTILTVFFSQRTFMVNSFVPGQSDKIPSLDQRYSERAQIDVNANH